MKGGYEMLHMQEEEFDKIKRSDDKCPPHEVVMLYYKGAHTDYGCKKCKMKSSVLSYFENEQLNP